MVTELKERFRRLLLDTEASKRRLDELTAKEITRIFGARKWHRFLPFGLTLYNFMSPRLTFNQIADKLVESKKLQIHQSESHIAASRLVDIKFEIGITSYSFEQRINPENNEVIYKMRGKNDYSSSDRYEKHKSN